MSDTDTESFEYAMKVMRENLAGMYANGHMTKWADIDTSVDLDNIQAAHDREIAQARDPQRLRGTKQDTFDGAIEALREFRWQHATNDEDAIPYINGVKEMHDREIRDTAQQEYDRGFHDGQHSMDAEHRAVAMRLRALPLNDNSHENLSNIAKAIWYADWCWGWTQGACMMLRDELVRLMGGVSDEDVHVVGLRCDDGCMGDVSNGEDTGRTHDSPSNLDRNHMAVRESVDTMIGDGDDACDSQCRGACAAGDGGGSGGQEEVEHGGAAHDCAADTRGGSGSELVHMDGLVAYDVLDNERRKAIAKLRKIPNQMTVDTINGPYYEFYEKLASAIGIETNEGLMFSIVRDRLVHLLGGDQPSGIDVLREMDAESDDVGTCPNDVPTSSITDELRKWANSDVWSCRWEEFEAIVGRIDERVKHDRESDQLRIVKLVEKRDELRLIIADVVEERDHWKELADTNVKALLRMGSENVSLKAECERLRKRLDSITEAIEHIKSLGQE